MKTDWSLNTDGWIANGRGHTIDKIKEDIKTLKKKLIEDIKSEKLKLITNRNITTNDVGFLFSNLYHIIDKRFGVDIE